MKLPIRLLVAAALAATAPACTPSQASTIDDQQACTYAAVPDSPPERVLAACSAIIDDGHEGQDVLAVAHSVRGEARCERNELDPAIADQTEAMRLAPTFPVPYRDRAACYRKQGDLGRALTDLGRAIALAPNFSKALSDRAWLYIALGEDDLALADLNAEVKSDPNDWPAINDRGRFYFDRGRFADAASDFARVSRIVPHNAYLPLWLHIARARAHIQDAQAFQSDIDKLQLTGWPRPIFDLFQGKLSVKGLEDVANQAPSSAAADEECDFVVFAGEYELLTGESAAARPRFEEAGEICVNAPHGRETARREAARLDPAYAASEEQDRANRRAKLR